MEVLANRTITAYNFSSRYNTVPYYYHIEDQKYIRGLAKRVSGDFEYSIHEVKQTDNLDKLAFHYYGRPDLYWIIADRNGIKDPFIDLWVNYNFLYIPAYKDIQLV